jgi:SRSO17 transposase
VSAVCRFRQGLTARKLTWAVGIPRHLKVYPADVQMIWPVAKRGRPRQRHIPGILSIPAEDMLANAKWHTISWRTGTKGKLKARFAAVRVRGLPNTVDMIDGALARSA